jgi:hypothetical protein
VVPLAFALVFAGFEDESEELLKTDPRTTPNAVAAATTATTAPARLQRTRSW